MQPAAGKVISHTLQAIDRPDGPARADITIRRGSDGIRFSLALADGRRVPQAHLRLGDGGRFVRQSFSEVNRLDLHCPQTEPKA